MMMVMMNDYESSQGDDINNWSAEDDGMVWDEDFDEDDDSGGSDVEDELFSTIENFIRTFHNGNYDAELDMHVVSVEM